MNFQLGWQIFHWRSREGEEVDFLVQMSPNQYLFVEAKVSAPGSFAPQRFPEIRKVFGKNPPDAIVCHQEGNHVFNGNVPIARLADMLLGGRVA